MCCPPLLGRGPSIDGGSRQGVTEAHGLAELDETGRFRGGGVQRYVEKLGCAKAQLCVAHRFGCGE